MKAAELVGILKIRVVDVPRPAIGSDRDVLVRVRAVGVCGSDVHYYETGRIGSQVVQYPFVVGHECAGTVEAVGSAVKNVGPGQNVFIEPAVSCHACDQCLAGRENTCRQLRFLGCPGQMAGCLCQYLVVPGDCCLPLPEGLEMGAATLCEPLAIGLYAVRGAAFSPGASVAILGSGPIGLSCLLAARHFGAKCLVTDRIPERVKVASEAGACWAGNPDESDVVAEVLDRAPGGVDAVFECAGQQDAIQQAISMLKPGGRLMLIGIPRQAEVSIPIDLCRRNEIKIINVRRQNRCTETCIELAAGGALDGRFMITHRFSLDRVAEAFDLVAGYRQGVIKALIEL